MKCVDVAVSTFTLKASVLCFLLRHTLFSCTLGAGGSTETLWQPAGVCSPAASSKHRPISCHVAPGDLSPPPPPPTDRHSRGLQDVTQQILLSDVGCFTTTHTHLDTHSLPAQSHAQINVTHPLMGTHTHLSQLWWCVKLTQLPELLVNQTHGDG